MRGLELDDLEVLPNPIYSMKGFLKVHVLAVAAPLPVGLVLSMAHIPEDRAPEGWC